MERNISYSLLLWTAVGIALALPAALYLENISAALAAGWQCIEATQSRGWSNGLFFFFLAGILAYGILFLWYLLSRLDLLNLVYEVSANAAFFYFQIAKNLAAGQFSTFDGGITQTNGYHPFWMLLITPFYWFTDAETALFGIKGLEVALIAGAVLLIVTAARFAGQQWLLLFALLPAFYANIDLFVGMEAAAALFALGLLLLTLVLYAEGGRHWPLTAVAFALPWVRLEYVAISLTATVALVGMVAWRREQPRPPPGWRFWRTRSTSASTAPLLGGMAGILTYFLYNWLVFGGPVPVSGAVKSAWSQVAWGEGYSLLRNFQDALQVPVFGYELLVALEVCVYAPLIWWLSRRAERRQDWLLLAFLVGVFSLGVGHIAKFLQTVLTVHPSLQGQFRWYFVPAYLLDALAVPVRCYVAIFLIRRYTGSLWTIRVSRLLTLGVVVAGVVVLLIKADFAEPFRVAYRSSNSTINYDQWAPAMYMGTQIANRVLPEGSVIGSWDAGVTGYFSRFPVVNLDGLVNSYDYFRTEPWRSFGRFRPVHRQLGVTHFVNIAPYDFESTLFSGTLDSSGRQLRISAAEPFGDAAAARMIWDGMAPYFDYQDGDVGLMVNDRVALALARNCNPEEVIVWSWGQSEGAEVFLPGKTGRKESVCLSEAVLPKAVPAQSVRVTAQPARDYLAQLRAKSLPAIRSRYDVYVTEHNLVYTKEPCTEDDRARFLLHLYPADAADLTKIWKDAGFEGWDFQFQQYGMRADGVCLVNAPLRYSVTRIRTGQFKEDGSGAVMWQEDVPTNPVAADRPLQR